MIVNDQYKKNLKLIHPTKFLKRKELIKREGSAQIQNKKRRNCTNSKLIFIKMHLHQMKHQRTLLMYKYKLNLLYKNCRDRKLTYSLA